MAKIGKYILATLTTGMYKDARMIYREYIQNSADQIDTLSADDRENSLRKTIVISISPEKRNVVIKDRATGIPEKEFEERLINVADSYKDPAKNKGFRGIGRLAGLSYCGKLIFRASAPNESSVSTMEMDCEMLTRILRNPQDRSSASEVMHKISKCSVEKNKVDPWDVFFEVELQDVNEVVGAELLDVDSVRDFISQVAPVPFSKVTFKYGAAIRAQAEADGVAIEEYTVQVNGKTMTKPYKDDIIDSAGTAIETVTPPIFKKYTYHDQLLAWGWFSLNATGKQLVGSQNPERKIRLRKGNIQVGFSDFLDGYFPEDRSNGYMIGEIYLLSKNIQPNGDRNGLEVSEEASAFMTWVKGTLFKDLWASVRQSSDLVGAKKAVADYQAKVSELEQLAKQNGVTQNIIEQKKADLTPGYEKAVQKLQKLKRAKSNANTLDDFAKAVTEKITADVETIADNVMEPAGLNVSVQSRAESPTTSIPKRQKKNPRDEALERIIAILQREVDLGVMDAVKIGNMILEEIHT